MKKVASLLLASVITLSGVTALAETKDIYRDAENSIKSSDAVTDNQFTTVKIENATKKEVVYINQNSDGFGAATSFMMKEGIESGSYTATFGNESGETNSVDFVVGEFSATGGKLTDGTEIESINFDTAQKMSVLFETLQDEVEFDTKDKYNIENGKYTKGFTFTRDNSTYTHVYFVSEDAKMCYGYYPLPEPENTTVVTGTDNNICYALQIWNIATERKNMNLYLGGAPE